MKTKYYAVKKGRVPGIYYKWEECLEQTKGFSGAEFKSFSSEGEALNYLKEKKVAEKKTPKKTQKNTAIAYVDGSYDSKTNMFSCGVVLFYKGTETRISKFYEDKALARMNNVAGELKGAEEAILYCLENKIKRLVIHYDYEGIEKWATGEWKTNKEGTIAYKSFFDKVSKDLKVSFVKVKAHSGDKYNELADLLAKNAFSNSENQEVVLVEIEGKNQDTVNLKENTKNKRKKSKEEIRFEEVVLEYEETSGRKLKKEEKEVAWFFYLTGVLDKGFSLD